MFRLPLPAIAVWLSLGMIAGWSLHAIYRSPVFSPASLDSPDGAPDTPAAGKKRPALWGSKTRVENLIEQGEYDRAFSQFDEELARNEQTTQKDQSGIIDSLSRLSENSPDEAQPLLRRLLETDAYNPQALFLLSKNYFAAEQYMRALEALFDLKSFNQTEIAGEDINSLLEQIETQYAAKLEESGRYDELLRLYQFLTTKDPSDTARFYRLAEIQHRMHHYYDALTSLNYVLYDPSWSKLAETLADEIQQSIALDDEIQVPLTRSGEHFIVDASINGIDGARLMIDTGASLCVLRPQAAQQFGLPTDSDDYVTLSLVTGVVNAPRISIGTLGIGDATVRGVKASVIEMPPDIDGDGLLGMNFLNKFKFFIDQKREILYLGSR